MFDKTLFWSIFKLSVHSFTIVDFFPYLFSIVQIDLSCKYTDVIRYQTPWQHIFHQNTDGLSRFSKKLEKVTNYKWATNWPKRLTVQYPINQSINQSNIHCLPLMSLSQRSPMIYGGQVQVNIFPTEVQVPLFMHGLLSQGGTLGVGVVWAAEKKKASR